MVSMSGRLLFTFILGAVWLCPGLAGAQTQSERFERLQSRAHPGQLIILTDNTGQKVVGKVSEISASALVIDVRTERARDGSGLPRYSFGQMKRFEADDILRVSKPGPIWDGAIKGAAVGLVAMALALSSLSSCTGCGPLYLTGAGIGAGIGLGVDAAFGPKTLYRR